MTKHIARTALLIALLPACAKPPPAEIAGTQVEMNNSADLTNEEQFFDFPYPSDLRLNAAGNPDLRGFPNPISNITVANLVTEAGTRPGFPVIPVGYFRFSAALAPRDPTVILPADKSSPILLVDVDPNSPDRGKLFPIFSTVLTADDYVPANVLAASAPTGVVLWPKRLYAFVVQRSLNDATGKALGSPLVLEQLKAGVAPAGSNGAQLAKLYSPIWGALEKAGLSTSNIAAATVFTTADVVQDLADMSTAVAANNSVQITGLHEAADYPSFCDIQGQVSYPQFQSGTPPFDTDGHFVLDSNGVPIQQGTQIAPVHISLPKAGPMPATGFPLMLYVHGSGGLSSEMIDRGYIAVVNGNPVPGTGPSSVIGPFGIAGAASAMPLNPERFPGATDYEYLNFNNPAAMPSTFRQGVFEQRMFLVALKSLQIPASAATGCTNLALPLGSSAFFFDPSHLVGMGHSMGAMYMNMLSSVEPRIQATVMSGAGGYWMNFIFETGLIPGATDLLGVLLGSNTLSVLHPVMHIGETAWETSEPLVFTPRVAKRPLPGAPVRPIYEPTGVNDAYFPEAVLDDMSLGYGNQEAGTEIWTTMQAKLALEGLQGLANYPVTQNLTSEDGTKYTGVAIQHVDDDIVSGHDLVFQFDDVKHQYSCFLSGFLATGTATAVAPGAIGSPCE